MQHCIIVNLHNKNLLRVFLYRVKDTRKYLYNKNANDYSLAFSRCAGHGTNSVGDKPTTGIYRQV